jgi:probable rRNA maturation factor
MIDIDVVSESNLWSKKIKRKDFFFKSIVRFLPKKYRFIGKKVSLTILLSNNKNIKKLNKKFRNNDKSTDVLSFPFEEKFNIKKNTYLGDIVISYDYMHKPKILNNLDFKKKVIKVFIHGFLHLLGYDHVKIKDYKKMTKEEENIYNNIKLKIAKLV